MLFIPKIRGIIDRRILINYRVESKIMKNYLPAPFEPLEVDGFAIVGICLIRLKQTRPSGLPGFVGISSENGAHRIAVKWKENGSYKEGVYIPRRDTNSILNMLAGGRLFPGKHYLSDFKVNEDEQSYEVAFYHKDGTYLEIIANETDTYPEDSIFDNLHEVSAFFEEGAIGYSPANEQCYNCVELKTYNWSVKPLEVTSVRTSFFDDESIFPKGSIIFDNALLMKNIDHHWQIRKNLQR